MKCPKCGQETPDESRFCIICGNDVNAPSESPEDYDDSFEVEAERTVGAEQNIEDDSRSPVNPGRRGHYYNNADPDLSQQPEQKQPVNKLLIAVISVAGVVLILLILVLFVLFRSCNDKNADSAQTTVATTQSTTAAKNTTAPEKKESSAQSSQESGDSDDDSQQNGNDNGSGENNDNESSADDQSSDSEVSAAETSGGSDLAAYFGTDTFEFPNSFPDVTKAGGSDGSNGWSNDYILVSTTPNQSNIDYICIKAAGVNSDYTIYGIKPGMSSSDAQSLVEAAGFAQSDSYAYTGDGKELRFTYDGDTVKTVTLTELR